MAQLWILLKAQMMSVGALGEDIPALQELEHALVKDKEGDKMGGEGSRERQGGEKFQVGERKEGKTARDRKRKPLKKTAVEGTPVHQKETARVRTQGPLKKVAKEGPQNP